MIMLKKSCTEIKIKNRSGKIIFGAIQEIITRKMLIIIATYPAHSHVLLLLPGRRRLVFPVRRQMPQKPRETRSLLTRSF